MLKALRTRLGSIRDNYRKTRRFRAEMPDWTELLSSDQEAWIAARSRAAGGAKVLIATTTGGDANMAMVESVLGVALSVRGANAQFLFCDEMLPACSLAQNWQFSDLTEYARDGPRRRLCPSCFKPAQSIVEALGLPILRLSLTLSMQEREQAKNMAYQLAFDEIQSFAMDSVAIGEHAYAGALRFFARGELPEGPVGEAVLRRYLHAALLTSRGLTNLIRQHHPEVAFFHHGIYVPLGVIGDVCRREGVRVVNWAYAYRKQCVIFSHDDTYHHTMLSEPLTSWQDMAWGPRHEREILAYLRSRWQGTQDWIWFHDKPEENVQAISQEVGIDFSKTTIGLLTNVVWDAQLHYRANAFSSMIEWVMETICYFSTRQDLQLLIRVHPAELRGNIRSKQPIVPEIMKRFPQLPPNVYIIPPESQASTYVAMSKCNAVIVYGTKTGVELTSTGTPVVVAGEAWIRNKGLTRDATSREHYRQILDELPVEPMPPEQVQMALKYAFHFFFRRMIPIPVLEHRPNQWPPNRVSLPNGLQELGIGVHQGLDVICDGILNGTPFVFPAELALAETDDSIEAVATHSISSYPNGVCS